MVKSFKDRVRARLPVSIAEIGNLELYQVATLAIAVVSGQSSRCSEVLSYAKSMAASLNGALLADAATEIISFGASGKSLRGGIEDVLDPGMDSQIEWPDARLGSDYKEHDP